MNPKIDGRLTKGPLITTESLDDGSTRSSPMFNIIGELQNELDDIASGEETIYSAKIQELEAEISRLEGIVQSEDFMDQMGPIIPPTQITEQVARNYFHTIGTQRELRSLIHNQIAFYQRQIKYLTELRTYLLTEDSPQIDDTKEVTKGRLAAALDKVARLFKQAA